MFYQMHYTQLSKLGDAFVFFVFIESIYISHITTSPTCSAPYWVGPSKIHQPSPGFYSRDRKGGRRYLLVWKACCWIRPMLSCRKTAGRESKSSPWKNIHTTQRSIPWIHFESAWPILFRPDIMCCVPWWCVSFCSFLSLSNLSFGTVPDFYCVSVNSSVVRSAFIKNQSVD